MLRSLKALEGYKIRTKDGECGKVAYFLFDDGSWRVRFMVVESGGWLARKFVLLAPQSVVEANWVTESVVVDLTSDQVKRSPDLDSNMPVARAHELETLAYYRWPYLWLGEGYWGPMLPYNDEPVDNAMDRMEQAYQRSDTHLRSTKEVDGYHLQANDDCFGHVEDFVVDDENWTLRYFVVATRNFWPHGRSVILAPQWISHISWSECKVHVDLDMRTIVEGPEYNPHTPVNREYEVQLYDYYGRPKYWESSRHPSTGAAKPSTAARLGESHGR